MSWDPQWSVEGWLEALGLAAYTDNFIDNGYDLQELCANLKKEDLDEIGVQKEEHRTLIFAKSAALRDEAVAHFKKSNGGGSAGSTDQSGSMGSHGSFPAYTEPWEEAQKHQYSDVWVGETAAGDGHGITPVLAQLMHASGGQGQAMAELSDRQKGLTFPPAPPPKAPRKKKVWPPISPAGIPNQSSLSPTPPALPPPRVPQTQTTGGLNKLQLKLKVREELQKDRIILTEAPYCLEDGSTDQEKLSELCQTYAERFHLLPAQILETVKDICRASDTKGRDETDTSTSSLSAPKTAVLSTSDLYEEPVDKTDNILSMFSHTKESSPPAKRKQKALTLPASTSNSIYEEPADSLSKPSPPQQTKGKKKKGSPPFGHKLKPSSNDSSPEQKRRASPRSSPCSSPHPSPRSSPHLSPRSSPHPSPQPSPVTSPREHKKFGLFGRKKDKKAARSQSIREFEIAKQSKGGTAVLLPGDSKKRSQTSSEDLQNVIASVPAAPAGKKLNSRASLTVLPSVSLPNGDESAHPHRTTSMSSTSTTGSETSPLAPKKFGIMRFSQRWGSPQRQRKAKTRGKKHEQCKKYLTASDFELHKVGLDADAARTQELMHSSQSHEELRDCHVQASPPTTGRVKVESKQRGGIFNLLRKKKPTAKKAGKGDEGGGGGRRRRHTGEEGEEEGGGSVGDVGQKEARSFLTSSMSMPDIASVTLRANKEHRDDATPPPTLQPGPGLAEKSKTAPPKPSRRSKDRSPAKVPTLSPDHSPLPQRKVVQSKSGARSADLLIPIRHGAGEGGAEGGISSWHPRSPSHMLLQHKQSFESDVFANDTANERGYPSEVSDTASISSREVVGSLDSRGSVFGSYTSESSFTAAQTAASGSVGAGSMGRKPAPPLKPKPKSLERGAQQRGRIPSGGKVTPPPGVSNEGKTESSSKERGGGGDGDGDKSKSVLPPPKPPRPMRGSVKKLDGERVQLDEEDGGGRGAGGRGGEEAKPPPKPARRNRTLKPVRPDEQDLSVQRKVQTMLPLTNTGESATWASRARQLSVDGLSGTSTPRRPVPTPKPRSSSSSSMSRSIEAVTPPPPSLEENVARKLLEEGIDLTVSPHSNVWGEGAVPAALVSRYAEELDHPQVSIALIMDERRGRELKKLAREYVPIKRIDGMKQTAVSKKSVSDFLTSIGLPMYYAVLAQSGYTNVTSLRKLNDSKLQGLGIKPPHSKLLLDQIHNL